MGRRTRTHINLLNEFNWIDKFNVMTSKNNAHMYKGNREYFDRPIEYDQRGYC